MRRRVIFSRAALVLRARVSASVSIVYTIHKSNLHPTLADEVRPATIEDLGSVVSFPSGAWASGVVAGGRGICALICRQKHRLSKNWRKFFVGKLSSKMQNLKVKAFTVRKCKSKIEI